MKRARNGILILGQAFLDSQRTLVSFFKNTVIVKTDFHVMIRFRSKT